MRVGNKLMEMIIIVIVVVSGGVTTVGVVVGIKQSGDCMG